MGTKTYVVWCIIWPLMAFTVGTMVGDFVMGEGIFTTRVGNAFLLMCAGTVMTFVAFGIAEVSVRILDKIDSKRNKNEENEEDKN